MFNFKQLPSQVDETLSLYSYFFFFFAEKNVLVLIETFKRVGRIEESERSEDGVTKSFKSDDGLRPHAVGQRYILLL